MSRASLALLLAAILGVCGCDPGHEEVRFPVRTKVYRTVVSLSPSTTEIVASLAFNLKLLGRTAADNFPPSVISPNTPVPVVAQVKPDYEKIKGLNPDLVVYDADLYNDQDVAQIKAMGMETFEFKAKTIDEFTKEILKFGGLTGTEGDSSAYADKVYEEKKAAEGDPVNPRPKVALILPGTAGQHMICGKGAFAAAIIQSAGGDVVGPDADRFVPIDAEALVQLDPDMIITAGKPDPLLSDPRLKSMKAIAGIKIRGIDQDLITRRGFRVDRAIRLAHQALQNISQGGK